ncbi:hypothetical protein T265_01786 [Opisthorchis viverrini]|uniref:Uncharacterized protein n=1 Tax=Opisthorchis viverrini TaxID=6198 RepID=A0A074ZYQ8_OPIVI|nr:hypothetical protein T265_01786 [Opisthorchis viverrini]KER32176.1 hypothetical protein T265_01786 [Opisthorchis viverrini]
MNENWLSIASARRLRDKSYDKLVRKESTRIPARPAASAPNRSSISFSSYSSLVVHHPKIGHTRTVRNGSFRHCDQHSSGECERPP